MIQKLLLNNPKTWEHHRSGWAFALNAISSKLCGIRGVLLEGYADGIAQQHRQIDEPWFGFIHNPVTFSKEARQIWHWMRGLDQILESEEWAASKPKCLGLFTLSQHCAEFLRANTDLQISSLLHPTAPGPLFSVDKFLRNQNRQLITIGWWLRKFQSLADLETDLNKARELKYKLEYTNLHDIAKTVSIYFDPKIDATNISDDKEILEEKIKSKEHLE